MKQQQIQPISRSWKSRHRQDDEDGEIQPLSAREFLTLPRRRPNGRGPQRWTDDQKNSDNK